MNLNYSILWYDDNKEFFESQDMEPIETEIASWGFQPKIFPVHNAVELQQHAPFDQYDMLVVDFDLGENKHGDQFIKDVRDQNVFAEIIFYSMKETDDLWQAVSVKRLEGVFVANKKNIGPKLIRVARQSVRKVLDLENMRGIVMAEVGDLDGLLEKIFILAMAGITEEHRQKVFNGFIEKSKEPDKKLEAALLEFEKAPSIDSLLQLCDSSDKRLQNVNRVKRHHPLLSGKNFAEEYQYEILRPRNFLAHGIPNQNNGTGFLFRHRGKEYTFDDDVSRTLREKILGYKKAFAEIVEALGQQ